MGNKIFIQNKRVCMKPLRSKLAATQTNDVEALQEW